MKSKIKRHSRSVMAVILTISMLISTMMVGLIATDAARASDNEVGGSTITARRIYFGVPNSWTSFSHIYVAAHQDNGCNIIIGEMTEQVSGSRLYGYTTSFSLNHGSWSTEYLYIFATDNTYSGEVWDANLSVKYDVSKTGINCTNINSESNNYWVYPTDTKTSGTAISYTWNDYDNVGYIPTDGSDISSSNQGHNPYSAQTVSVYTDSSSSSTGGSVQITGYQYTYQATSVTSATSDSILRTLVGSNVIMTATPAENYYFDGFYSDSSLTTPLTSEVSTDGENVYTYINANLSGKTVYASFKPSNYDVTVESNIPNGSLTAESENGGGLTTLTGTHTITVTADPESGYEVVWPDGYTSTDTNTATVEVSGATTITAQFLKPEQAVTVHGGKINGSTTASARPGTTVTVTPDVVSGFKPDTISFDVQGVSSEKHGSGTSAYFTFTMPEEAVTATVNFVQLASYKVTATDDGHGYAYRMSGTVTNGYATEGTVLTYQAYADDMYTFGHWENASGENIGTNESLTVTVTGEVYLKACFTYTPYATVTAEANNDTYGEILSVSPENAFSDDTVTVTFNPTVGYRATSATVTYGDDTALPSAISTSLSEANKTVTFTMPELTTEIINKGLKVTVTFTNATTDSTTWFYNGYDISTGNYVSGYQQQAFKESYINGQKYAYYHVTGRTGTDQGCTVLNSSSSTNYIYFENNYSWGGTIYAYFWNASGKYSAWPGEAMTHAGTNNGKDVYRIVPPAGMTGVVFNNSSGDKLNQTKNTTVSLTKNYYYVSGDGDNTNGRDVANATNSNFPSNLTEYWWNTTSGVYDNSLRFGSNLYLNEHGANQGDAGNNRIVKVHVPTQSDYYVIIYYANTDYGKINGVTANNNTDHIIVVAQTTMPGEIIESNPTVKVYAKDGAIRRYGTSRNPGSDQDYSTFEKHANTFIYSDSEYNTHIGTRSSTHGASGRDELTDTTVFDRYTYDYAAAVEKGSTLYITTVVDSTLNSTHDLIGYCINGTVYDMYPTDAAMVKIGGDTGQATYKYAFPIPSDWSDSYVEITPIYKDRSVDMIRFYVQGYDDSVKKSGWGNTVGVYPYYEGLRRANNSFGGYPGQPMVYYKGSYYADIPVTHSSKTIKGITLSNMYWDDVHLMTGEVNKHHQTYDFDDLYKIYVEYPNDTANNKTRNIICSFKFETKKDNDEPGTVAVDNYADGTGNGWEVLTNYAGTPVDIFGQELNVTKAEVEAMNSGVAHVISQDYKVNCAGDFATEWAVYGTNNSKITRIVPSALIIRHDGTYASRNLASYMTETYGASTAAFADEYTALETAGMRDVPVMITYEKSIWGGYDQAERCDARWYWSYTGDQVKANVKIQYSRDLGATYSDDSDSGTSVTGNVTQKTAGITGGDRSDSSYVYSTVGGTAYNLTSTGSGDDYKFVGWYAEREGVLQELKTTSSTPWNISNIVPDSNVTYIARYMYAPSDSFSINHEILPNSKGTGDLQVTAQLYNSSGGTKGTAVTGTLGKTSGVTVTNLSAGSGEYIIATFSATAAGSSTFDNFYGTVSQLLSAYANKTSLIESVTIDTSGTTKTATVKYLVDKMYSVKNNQSYQAITSITHYSNFTLNDVIVNLTYTFPTRFYGDKTWTLTDYKLTEEELNSFFSDQINAGNAVTTLTKKFVAAKAPKETQYRATLKWNEDSADINRLSGSLTATRTEDTEVTATIINGDGSSKEVTATYLQPFKENGNYIKAAAVQNKYFHYWDIFSANTNQLVARSYSENFNYVGFEDYVVYAQYSDSPVNRQQEALTDTATANSVSVLELTRNHWGAYTNGAPVGEEKDRLYVDFVLNYHHNGKLVSSDSEIDKLGFYLYKTGSNTKVAEYWLNNEERAEISDKNRYEYCYGIKNSNNNANLNLYLVPVYKLKSDNSIVQGTPSATFCFKDLAKSETTWGDNSYFGKVS